MKTQRQHTKIIKERAEFFASCCGCKKSAQQAAGRYAENLFNAGNSGARSISSGVKIGRIWKETQRGELTLH